MTVFYLAQAIREAVQNGPVISGMFIGPGMMGWGRGKYFLL